MTRQRILFLVSGLTILVGIGWIWSFFEPVFDPRKPRELNPVLIILGTLLLLIGWGLFRRHEFALELGFWLWFTGLIWNGLSTAILLAEIGSLAISRNWMAAIFLSLLLALQLFVVIFLGQKETKRLFIPDSTKNAQTVANEQELKA